MEFKNILPPEAIVENINKNKAPLSISQDYYVNLALAYASKGCVVFPVNWNKIPYKGMSWTKFATNEPEKIRLLWQHYPDGRPAVVCRPSNLLIIDIDNKPYKEKYGFNYISELANKLGKLPKTVSVFTQSNGMHLYFRRPQNRKFVRNIGNCIDIQDNFYCVCGGVFTEQNIGYRFVKGLTFDDVEVAELPENWIEFLSKPDVSHKNVHFSDKETIKIEADIEELAENCFFVKNAIENAQILSENDWFWFGAILNNLENGYELFDKYSQPHPEYDIEKTKAKFLNAGKYSAMSCNSIMCSFEGCKNCKNKPKENNNE